ncbi:WbqC family protein [Wenyingzhuangia sp. IMCC45533]
MKAAIMQPYFFPYVGYFQLIDSVDTFIIYEYVTFRKKSWITRNRILDKGKNEPVFINIPIQKQSSNKLIKDVDIDYSIDWKKKLLNIIFFNYKKAKHFDEIYSFIEKLLDEDVKDLHTFNAKKIIQICNLLNIKTKIIFDNSHTSSIEEEIQPEFLAKNENTMSERVVKLCEKHFANTYINPVGGQELYYKDYFKEKNLNLFFVDTGKVEYPQFTEPHTPYLSIIDMLMHKGIDGTKQMIKSYKLI